VALCPMTVADNVADRSNRRCSSGTRAERSWQTGRVISQAVEKFEAQRSRLFGIAYRMLGGHRDRAQPNNEAPSGATRRLRG
jgi:hypothetical protein